MPGLRVVAVGSRWSHHSGRATEPTKAEEGSSYSSVCLGYRNIHSCMPFVRLVMRDELFSGFSETGWDAAPWDVEPTFTAEELQILLNPALTPAEAAYRVGCVVHDVIRLRRTA